MTTLTIVLLVSLGLAILLFIIIFLTEKSKVSKDDSSEVKKGEEDKKESSKEHATKGGYTGGIILIIFILVFLCLLVYVIVDYYQEKVYPWDEEVKVELRKKITETTLEEMAVFQTPRTIKFDYAFDIETNGRPYAILWSGTNVPICYCDDDKKDPYIRKRNKGPNTITKPSKECWKMCKN